ncbi:TniQ family protein [Planktotalea arctica]|uniref:TniQ family protein n=1 Tax=Planktotalea arctica TaxID=1481893 RepID=UPI00321B3D21
MNRLRLQPSQSPGETAASLISRIAAHFNVDAKTFCNHKGVSFVRVVAGDPQVFEALRQFGTVLPENLLDWSPIRRPSRIRSFRTHEFPSKALQTSQVRGCPVCLRLDAERSKEPAHIAMKMRGQWLVPHVTLCLIHNHPLVPLWRDPTPTSRYDSAPHLKSLAPQILSGDLDQDDREETDFDLWIDARLQGEQGSGWLDQFQLNAAANFCFMLGSTLLRHEGITPYHISKFDHWSLYQIGFEVACRGPEKIKKSLRKVQELPGSPLDGPKKIFPIMYERLAFGYAGKDAYRPFQELLRQHMLETWPLGVGDELLGKAVTERKVHSVLTAARATGVDQRRLRKMLAATGIVREANIGLSDAWEVFDAVQAKPALDALTDLIDAKAFAASIGATRSQFELLAKCEVISPALKDTKVKAIWDPAEGQALLDSLLLNAVQIQEARHPWVHLPRSAQRLKIEPGPIIKAIQNGRVKLTANHSGRDGYASIFVNHEEVVQTLSPPLPEAQSIEAFAKAVGINQPSRMRRLVMKRHTPSTVLENPTTKAKQHYLTQEDAAAFHSKFMTLRTIAQAYKRSWQSIGAELKTKGVTPFTQSGETFGNLFLRKEVEAVFD